ncbi:MAG: DNA adenine methylase, partial [Desulfovibrionaceae bacterium]
SPLAGWLGGKRKLARRIIQRMPEHSCYVEPFAGAAWVLFSKPPSRVEVLNDRNDEVVNLFRVVQRHPEELQRQFHWAVNSRCEFDRLLRANPEGFTDVQRAARFYALLKWSFNGRLATFRYSRTSRPRLDLDAMLRDLQAVRQRLADVYIENRDFETIMQRFDGPGTFFYLDPPYQGKEHYYGRGLFCFDDFRRLAAAMRRLQGGFLLSINDTPEARRLFDGFPVEEIRAPYSCRLRSGEGGRELFITNTDPRRVRGLKEKQP